MKIVGLTGGIGMGKSTAAAVFRRAGIPVFDADRAVHRLQGLGGRAVPAIDAAFPGHVREGVLDRGSLRNAVLGCPGSLARLEHILHPMVREEEETFLKSVRRCGRGVAVLDVPLLLETGGECRTDLVVVVSAPRDIQERRVRRRQRMTAAEAGAMIARQMPDEEKRRRADIVVQTGLSRHYAFAVIRRLIQELRNDPRYTLRYRNNRTRAASRPSCYRNRSVRVS